MDTTDAPKLRFPPKKILAELDTTQAAIEQDDAERSKARRENVRRIVERHHVHVEAFALTRKLKSMDPAARNAFLGHLLHYVVAFGLDKQLDFFDVPVADQIEHMAQAGHREGLGGSRARA